MGLSDPKKFGPGPVVAIEVENFKSISTRQRLTVRPVTIIAGANSSGKSSLMQPLLLIKQTLDHPVDPGTFLLDGPNLSASSGEQILTRSNGSAASEFFLALDFKHAERLELRYAYSRREGFSIRSTTCKKSNRVVWSAREHTPSAVKERCFLVLYDDADGYQVRKSPVDSFWHWTIIHLPGLRDNPQRDYPITGATKRFPGTFHPYVASLIQRWQSGDKPKIDLLQDALGSLGLTNRIHAQRLDDTRVRLEVGRLPRSTAKDLVSIADVGLGVSQVLPALVALIAAKRGDWVYLEQPEIHLHPKAQGKLAQLLIDAAKRGATVIAETHSSILIRELQTLIATGKAKSADVALNWCERDPKTGATKVTLADLDENGAFGDWPEDFDDTILASEGRYLDAVARRRKRKAR